LVYITGGVAYGNPFSSADNSVALFLFPGFAGYGFNNNRNEFRVGYTGGGGLEYAFTPNWSVKAEYNYVDLGRQSSNFGTFFGGGSRSTAHVARLGVNYHFNFGSIAPVVARY
ncbi:outer membrane protein, partial [Klebsiella pneumoniae]|uniref:outer membrane protein n=1 Tax=Klebsiella pneumoniae TaxID=573 RepID=UPI0015E69214